MTAELGLADRLVLALLFIFLITEVFGGALRYYLSLMDAPWLVYAPKMFMVAAYFGLAIKSAHTLRIRRTLLGSMLLFLLFLLVAARYTQNLVQPLFGTFALLPLLFSILAEPTLTRLGARLLPCAGLLWICAAAGVVYEYFADVPWSGLTYQLAGLQVEGSRVWTTFGIERIAGFSRASYEAAGQLFFLALLWMVLARRKRLATAAWLATGALIALTTSKTFVGVYLIMTLLLPLMHASWVPRKLKRTVAVVAPVTIVLVGIALPFSTLIVHQQLDLNSYVSRFLFASFGDRLSRTWPQGLALVFAHGNAALGRGIGGIGVAQAYFEPRLESPADNLYLYLYATFGVIALPIIIMYTTSVCGLAIDRNRWARMMWFLAVAVLMSGWTANDVEGAFPACALGLTLAYAARQRRAVRALRSLNSQLTDRRRTETVGAPVP